MVDNNAPVSPAPEVDRPMSYVDQLQNTDVVKESEENKEVQQVNHDEDDEAFELHSIVEISPSNSSGYGSSLVMEVEGAERKKKKAYSCALGSSEDLCRGGTREKGG